MRRKRRKALFDTWKTPPNVKENKMFEQANISCRLEQQPNFHSLFDYTFFLDFRFCFPQTSMTMTILHQLEIEITPEFPLLLLFKEQRLHIDIPKRLLFTLDRNPCWLAKSQSLQIECINTSIYYFSYVHPG